MCHEPAPNTAHQPAAGPQRFYRSFVLGSAEKEMSALILTVRAHLLPQRLGFHSRSLQSAHKRKLAQLKRAQANRLVQCSFVINGLRASESLPKNRGKALAVVDLWLR